MSEQGVESKVGIRLSEAEPGSLLLLRGPPADEAFHGRAAAKLGVALPRAPGLYTACAGQARVWLGPDEWLVFGPAGQAAALAADLRATLADWPVAVVDLSAGKVTLRLSGSGAADVLAGGCSLDVGDRAFPSGFASQTLLAQCHVLLLRRDDEPTFDILVPRSFAGHLRAWLADAVGGT